MALFHRREGRYSKQESKGKTDIRRTATLASATLITSKQIRAVSRRLPWQEEAWSFYDCVGELRASARWLGNALSRSRLFIAQTPDDPSADPSPVDNPPQQCVDLLADLFSGPVGQGEMMRRLGLNLDVVGEAYLIRIPSNLVTSDGPQDQQSQYKWITASIDEFTYTGGRCRLKLPESGQSIDVEPEQCTIIRLWCPHPRVAWEADSPVRANLPTLREAMALSQWITATVDSRLAGAGVLVIPKSATLPNPSVSEGANPLHQSQFVEALVDAMIIPVRDRDNASALVPIVLSVDDSAIGKIQHLNFWSELSDQAATMRQAALERFAAGSELPKEIILGLGDSSHWNAWEIEDQAIKIATEPLAGVICDALTQQYLWPALRAMGEKNPEQWLIWYSSSELAGSPDRSAEAQALYDRGVLSPDALLRENGFNTEDAPSDDERKAELARQVVLAQPSLLGVLAPYVGFGDDQEKIQKALQPPPGAGPGGEPGGAGDKPMTRAGQIQSEEQNPEQQRPRQIGGSAELKQITGNGDTGDTTVSGDAGWQLVAIEQLALRALELAGKRLLTSSSRGLRGKPEAQQLHAWDLHTVAQAPPKNVDKLLSGAFDLMSATLGDQPCIREAVDVYCRTLLTSGKPHRREYLIETLYRAGCLS